MGPDYEESGVDTLDYIEPSIFLSSCRYFLKGECSGAVGERRSWGHTEAVTKLCIGPGQRVKGRGRTQAWKA